MASDSTYGLDSGGDEWTTSYDSPTLPKPKTQTPPTTTGVNGSGYSTDTQPSYSTLSGNSSTTPGVTAQTPYGSAPASAAAPPPDPGGIMPGQPGYITGNGMPQVVDPVAADQQARNIANSLQQAGHDVKWNGNQLMVDGRPYDLGSDQPGVGPGLGASTTTGQKPSGGRVSDQNYAAQMVAWAAAQPGADPSLASNPSYWIQKITSGEFGADETYIYNKMATAWKDAPGGGGGGSLDGLVPSYASIAGTGDPSALMPDIAMPDAPWAASGGIPTYQPGAITFDDIPNFTPEQLQAQMRSGGAATSLDALMQDIENNPTSLDQHTVDTMKAQMKDTLAEQGQLEDQVRGGNAAALGIGDSPWLASERSAARRSTGQAIAAGGQNIDIEAGKTRQSQKLASAASGQAYQSVKDKQVMDSVNAGLERARVTGDRMALRESVAQAAAKSKQDAFQIQANWLSQQTGQKISAAALKQQGQEFAESLMMQLAGMNIGVQEFGSDFGLRSQTLLDNENNSDWQHTYMDTHDLNPQ